MGLIARMEAEGRLEALRENRDHFHLFAFAQGRRPDERLIAEALGDVRPVRLAQARSAPVRKARSAVKGRAAARPAAARRRAAPAPKKTAVRKPAPRTGAEAADGASARPVLVLDHHQAGADLRPAA